ncbi:MAG: SH3 domain-containing protein [Chloroflexota bacterium]
MKNISFLIILILLSLACSLTTPPSLPQDMPAQVSNITHLATATQDPDPILHTMPVTCTVSAQSLHLRECAGLHCTVLAWLSTGDVLDVLDADQDWLNVTTPTGQTGWVHSKYCGGTQ